MKLISIYFIIVLFLIVDGQTVTAQERGIVAVPVKEKNGTSRKITLYHRSYAFVVGIDNYSDPQWPRLSSAILDAGKVAKDLRRRGFEVTLLKNLKSQQLEDAFEQFLYEKGADKNARLFIWFAGHGHTIKGEGYLVPADAPAPDTGWRFRRNAISMRDFGKWMREARAKHVLAVFDSCFSGTVFTTVRAAPPPTITRKTARSVRQFISSGEAGQFVSDDGQFRKLFLAALSGKETRADANGDGYITGMELGNFLSDKLADLTENAQVPRFGPLRAFGFDRGDFVFRIHGLTEKEYLLTPDPHIRQVQQLLTSAGYYSGRADGLMSDKIRKSIRSYQQKSGLNQNGEINIGLLQRLLDDVRGGRLKSKVYFYTGSAEITPFGKQRLNKILSAINDVGGDMPKRRRSIVISAHASAFGNKTNNKKLSQDRLDNIRNYFLSKGYRGSLVTRSFGSAKPIPGSDPFDGINDRVEIFIQ